MKKTNIILIIGQNKNNDFLKKSIDIYSSRNDINKIVLVTWQNENIDYIKKYSDIRTIVVPQIKFDLNIKYQKHLYDIGIKYICNNYKNDDIYVLKTRMDVIISNEQLNFIFNQNYKLDYKNDLFPYKLWIPWVHITCPFYNEDCCFYSNLLTMKNMTPYTGKLFTWAGHSNIRWFVNLARKYDLYDDETLYNNYEQMKTLFPLNKINRDILIKYRNCVKSMFIINTIDNGVIFRHWNHTHFYQKPSNQLIDIINNQHEANLKIVYNNEDFTHLNI
tara:strand:+ start:488 stop:1315 length:828 start_codon:yes stop_codon:yes gene_type:complete